MIQNGQHKAEFWCFLYREKQPIFLLRVSLFFNEGIRTTQHIPRASENFPLEKSLWVHGKTTKKLMEVPLFAFLPPGPCHPAFQLYHMFILTNNTLLIFACIWALYKWYHMVSVHVWFTLCKCFAQHYVSVSVHAAVVPSFHCSTASHFST